MKKLAVFFLVCTISTISYSQKERKNIYIPDIPEYYTLKCDFHIHTVFSDGNVWPTVRVWEAWYDGLDAIALTDHLEYTPKKDDIIINRNRPYEIAKEVANQKHIILIKGAELTRNYPIGHMNMLFVEDAEKLNLKDSMAVLAEAKKQNAVIQWNHPGWLKPNEIPEWTSVQQTIYDKGLMNMIEIINETAYYPLAQQWALDKNLAISANSDVHDPIYMNYGGKIHRPITLVFAKEKTSESIKEAILKGRTAVYHFDTLMGKEEFLKPIFERSLKVTTPIITIVKKQWIDVILENTSDVPLMISFKGGSDEYASIGSGIYIPAHGAAAFTVKGLIDGFEGERNYSIPCVIDNYYVGPRIGMKATIQFKVKFEK